MSHQSYRDVFVSNNPALLTSGFSDILAVGQLGIFVYDPKKDQVAVTPNFSVHPTIQLIQGTPELPGNLLAAVANQSDRSKPIKGKKILSWTGRAAERGQNGKIALGFDGADNTKTISARCEESKTIFVKLSGGPIDEIFHTEGKGYVRQYNVFSGCCDDCGDDCAQVSAERMADDLVTQIMSDPIMSLGTRTGNKLIRASKVVDAEAPEADAECTEYLLSQCDNGDDTSLGLVQAFYPGSTIIRLSRSGSTSTYQLIQDSEASAPADFSNAGFFTISECPTCPSGYTSVNNAFAYKVTKDDAGDAAALTAVATQYSITGTESVTRVKYQFGQSTYVVVSAVALTSIAQVNEVQSVVATGGASGSFTLTFDGQTTAAIAYNATATDVQNALLALAVFNPGDITAAGGPLPTTPVTLTFGGRYAGTNVAQLVVVDSITGGDAVVTTSTAGVAGGGTLELLSDSLRPMCVLNTPSTTAWVEGETYERFNKTYKITLNDDVCGTSRLADLQAAYPDLTIAQTLTGECVGTFSTDVPSNCVPPGCPADVPVWVAPDAFEGIEWVAAAPTYTGTPAVGVIFESSFVDRTTSECAYDFWSYDAEPIFIEVSEHSYDYNAAPTICANEWPVTEIQAVKIPIGVGSQVREMEAFFKGYDRKYRDANPIVRQLQDSVLQADPDQLYDQYTLEFEFQYHQAWFSEKLTDTYRVEVYFPEGKGKQFEALVNSYVASVGVDLEPVVL